MTGSPDDEREPERGGLLGGLRSLLEALADADQDGTNRVSRRRRSEKGRFSTDIGFSGRLGRPSSGPGSSGDSDSATGSDPSSISDRSAPGDRVDEDYHVDVRHDADGRLVVVADMPGVDHEDLTVGLDEESNELVVGVDERAIERMPLPWPVEDVEGRFNHGVLELRITAAEDHR